VLGRKKRGEFRKGQLAKVPKKKGTKDHNSREKKAENARGVRQQGREPFIHEKEENTWIK